MYKNIKPLQYLHGLLKINLIIKPPIYICIFFKIFFWIMFCSVSESKVKKKKQCKYDFKIRKLGFRNEHLKDCYNFGSDTFM